MNDGIEEETGPGHGHGPNGPPAHDEAFYRGWADCDGEGGLGPTAEGTGGPGATRNLAWWLRGLAITVLLLVVVAVVVAFQLDAVKKYADPRTLVLLVSPFSDTALAAVVAVAGVAVLGSLGVPITLLVILVSLLFDFWLGSAYAYAGVLLSATLSYWGGRSMGKPILRMLVGRRLDRIARFMAKADLVTLAMLRFVPVLPFAVVNLTAGATGVRQVPYLISTALASAPGVLAVALVGESLGQALRSPSLGTIGLAAGVVVAVAAISLGLKLLIRKLFPSAGKVEAT